MTAPRTRAAHVRPTPPSSSWTTIRDPDPGGAQLRAEGFRVWTANRARRTRGNCWRSWRVGGPGAHGHRDARGARIRARAPDSLHPAVGAGALHVELFAGAPPEAWGGRARGAAPEEAFRRYRGPSGQRSRTASECAATPAARRTASPARGSKWSRRGSGCRPARPRTPTPPVDPVGSQGIEHVGDRDDARGQRNLLPATRLGIAAAVPLLVMRQRDRPRPAG